jgi:hypothetical protein
MAMMAEREDSIHVVSATVIVVSGGGRHHLAMCGEDLGPYETAIVCHPVGNHLAPRSKDFARVTCQACRDRCNETWNRWYS